MLNHFHSFVSVAAVVLVAATVAPAQADGTVMFNYQGRVKVQGNEFNGDGQFKFAIVSPSGEATLWSSDGTSVNGSEPTTGITLPVTDGVFNVVMGANGVMQPINSTVFQSKVPLKLRTWFNDGTNGFQQLHPDHNLINTSLITSETSDEDFIIYVDGQNGNDNNSGLKPNQAKKTIQAAVDIVPSRVLANVTIDVADGLYPEEIIISGINVKPGKALKIKGADWTPSNVGLPSVVVSGADSNLSATRQHCVLARQCTGIEFEGIIFEKSTAAAMQLENGIYTVANCVTRNNEGTGLMLMTQVHGTVVNHTSTSNTKFGIAISTASRGQLTSCTSTNNSHGIIVTDNSNCNLYKTGNFSYNEFSGIHCIASSQVGFSGEYVGGVIRYNKVNGLVAGWNAYYHNLSGRNTITNNGNGSSSANQFAFNGGQLNY